VSLGLTAGAEVLVLLLRPHHQVTPARPVTCTTRGPAGWPTAPPDDTPGQVKSGSDPPTRPSSWSGPFVHLHWSNHTGCVLTPLCKGDARKQPPLKEDHRRAFPQVNPGVVGLAGLEPAASFLSANAGTAVRTAACAVTPDHPGPTVCVQPAPGVRLDTALGACWATS
jgi:hypothetical protein